MFLTSGKIINSRMLRPWVHSKTDHLLVKHSTLTNEYTCIRICRPQRTGKVNDFRSAMNVENKKEKKKKKTTTKKSKDSNLQMAILAVAYNI